MVRLKVKGYAYRVIAERYFNSTMVRLKDDEWHRAKLSGDYFNSTMVRLKECGSIHPLTFRLISIPLWYD